MSMITNIGTCDHMDEWRNRYFSGWRRWWWDFCWLKKKKQCFSIVSVVACHTTTCGGFSSWQWEIIACLCLNTATQGKNGHQRRMTWEEDRDLLEITYIIIITVKRRDCWNGQWKPFLVEGDENRFFRRMMQLKSFSISFKYNKRRCS